MPEALPGETAAPVTLFIGTEKGFTYRLALTPVERESAQILIPQPRGGSVSGAGRGRWGRRPRGGAGRAGACCGPPRAAWRLLDCGGWRGSRLPRPERGRRLRDGRGLARTPVYGACDSRVRVSATRLRWRRASRTPRPRGSPPPAPGSRADGSRWWSSSTAAPGPRDERIATQRPAPGSRPRRASRAPTPSAAVLRPCRGRARGARVVADRRRRGKATGSAAHRGRARRTRHRRGIVDAALGGADRDHRDTESGSSRPRRGSSARRTSGCASASPPMRRTRAR